MKTTQWMLADIVSHNPQMNMRVILYALETAICKYMYSSYIGTEKNLSNTWC